MRNEHAANQAMKQGAKKTELEKQMERRAKNHAWITEQEEIQSAANIAKFDRFIKNALFMVIGLFIALLLREYGIWA